MDVSKNGDTSLEKEHLEYIYIFNHRAYIVLSLVAGLQKMG